MTSACPSDNVRSYLPCVALGVHVAAVSHWKDRRLDYCWMEVHFKTSKCSVYKLICIKVSEYLP